ncbi:MAG TPA: hypothetical protein VGR22_03155 [Thermomicrobiales bacterium]|nr:hypothetical protein [Thermomicrobiales bacterium]
MAPHVLPMRGIVYTPVTLYLGKAEGWTVVQMLGMQLVWLAALWVFADWAWRAVFDAVEVQGG